MIVAAARCDPAASADARQSWFVAALVFSLVGDVLLMLPNEQFVAGLSAFLVAHLLLHRRVLDHGPALGAVVVATLVAVVLVIGLLGRRILPARCGSQDRALVGPVAAYMVVIGAMVATALAVGNPVAAVGAMLFAASDTMIAWDRFVGTVPERGRVDHDHLPPRPGRPRALAAALIPGAM